MNELELKYGMNPNQKPSRIFMRDGSDLPLTVLNGKPGFINFLDALNSWQLVCDLKEATGMPSAASFKHVSPAGAAVGTPLSDVDRQIYFVEDDCEVEIRHYSLTDNHFRGEFYDYNKTVNFDLRYASRRYETDYNWRSYRTRAAEDGGDSLTIDRPRHRIR